MVAFNRWSAALTRLLSTRPGTTAGIAGEAHRHALRSAFAGAKHFGPLLPTDKDIWSLAHAVEMLQLREAYGVEESNRVLATSRSLKAALGAAVVAEGHAPTLDGAAHGLTAYQVSCAATRRGGDYGFYRTLDFRAASTWGDFLDAFANQEGCAV